MELFLILPLLVALVPIALFLALVRRRQPEGSPPRTPQAEASGPPRDFGLARETQGGEAQANPSEDTGGSSGAAAAAAGGALIVGYEASRRADSEPDGDGAEQEGSDRPRG